MPKGHGTIHLGISVECFFFLVSITVIAQINVYGTSTLPQAWVLEWVVPLPWGAGFLFLVFKLTRLWMALRGLDDLSDVLCPHIHTILAC